MSNLPPGSSDDPLAPWNKSDKLCRYCDAEDLRDILYEQVLQDEECADDCIDERVEELLSAQPLCKDCAKEEYYDYDDDNDY
jgi:hypothetical protein